MPAHYSRSAGPTTSAAVTKRVSVILGGPGTASGGSLTNAGGGLLTRYKMTLGVKPVRYRVRIKNYSTALQTVGGALTLTGVAVAVPAYTNATGDNRWTGDTAVGTPVSLTISNTVIDGTVTDTITDWQTNAGEISEYTPFTLSVGVTNPNAGASAAIYNEAVAGYSYVNASAGAAGNVLATSPVGTKVRTPYLDVRLEVEYATLVDTSGMPAVPVGLIVGDSITSGLTGDASLTASSLTQEETWPGRAALRERFMPINLGIAQKTAQNFVSNWAAYTSARVDLTTTVPDFAVVALGINDVKVPSTAAAVETALMTVITNIRALGIPRIYLCTIVPGGWSAAITTTASTTTSSAAVTAIPSTFGMVPGMAISGTGIPASATVVSVDSPNQVTISAVATATGTAVAITVDKFASSYVSTAAMEAVRVQVNEWMRRNPYGVTGIFDFDKALRLEAQPGMADPSFISIYPHPNAGGYTRMSNVVVL